MASIYSNVLYDGQVNVTQSGAEITYALMYKALYDKGILTSELHINVNKELVGTESNFMLLFYLSMLVRYFTLIQADINNNACVDGFMDGLDSSYSLTCVRQTMFCRYGLENIYDLLYSKLTTSNGEGIGAMTIEGGCNIFTVS